MRQSALPCVLTINGGSSSIRFAVYEAGETLRAAARRKDRSHRRERHEFDRQGSGGTPQAASALRLPTIAQRSIFCWIGLRRSRSWRRSRPWDTAWCMA